jgi:hypothetical protein
MLADFLTKPLQGALFQKFKRLLMGFVHIDTLYTEPPLSPKFKERVGDHHLILKKANLSDQYVSERNSKVPISEVPKVPVVQHTHTGTSRIARATEVGVSRETSMSDYTELQEKDRDDEPTLESEWTEVQKRTRKVHFAANVPVDVPQVPKTVKTKQANKAIRSHSLF